MDGQLGYVGLTRTTSPGGVGDRLQLNETRQMRILQHLELVAPHRMILSTCERFEVYYVTGRDITSSVLDIISRKFGHSVSDISGHARQLHGPPVALHLLRIAAGLESRIIGEPHILGQVRRSYLRGAKLGSLGAVLSALARAAIHTGKRVRHEGSVNPHRRSAVSLAIDELQRKFGSMIGKTVAVVGGGELAMQIARALRSRKVSSLIVSARNLRQATAITKLHGGIAMNLTNLRSLARRSDAMVVCTCSPDFLITRETLASASSLHLVDLSIPRNVDPAVVAQSGVTLVHLDELVSALGVEHTSLEYSNRIVADELARFTRWQDARCVAPRIATLVSHFREFPQSSVYADNRELHRQIMLLKSGVAA